MPVLLDEQQILIAHRATTRRPPRRRDRRRVAPRRSVLSSARGEIPVGCTAVFLRERAIGTRPLAGRPGRRLDFQRQYDRKPARCQRITVSGRMMGPGSVRPLLQAADAQHHGDRTAAISARNTSRASSCPHSPAARSSADRPYCRPRIKGAVCHDPEVDQRFPSLASTCLAAPSRHLAAHSPRASDHRPDRSASEYSLANPAD